MSLGYNSSDLNMKNKIVISIGSLLACIALVSVLIAAVGPPPILRNSMTTNQNVWEKSGSSMTWTGNVAVAGVVSAGTTGTASTNLASYGQLLGAITNGINQVITGGTNQAYGSESFVNSNGVVNALGPFSSATGPTQGSNLVTKTYADALALSGIPPGVHMQIPFNSNSVYAATTDYYNPTNGNTGLGVSGPLSKLDVNGGVAIGTYAGSVAAPANGLSVSGNVGIGTATAPYKLTVLGGDGNNPGIYLNAGGAFKSTEIVLGTNGGIDCLFGIVGTNTVYWTESLPGDTILRSIGGRLVLTTGYGILGLTMSTSGDVGLRTANPTDVLHVASNQIRVDTPKTPSSSGDTGLPGQICWDANFIYVCVSTNTWKKTAISSW